ncbi:hypothetical protein H4R33_003979 [Dimargaris cristalligena]|uniref:Major facilitator superfamily domain-containing protein n=1 Tax=Dimargaris cristalligena TaxID=215637 RepID=A0A4Q0A023_9FUNG|nr:hypothetical protein H4R33_003979 [Dimargaris cristalligena]RKP39337.1 major facilitator superfamily domain-containing protein [Dimargaris cristalligena]|eukprot:RKP39337.1 major facilitator superfamily domain-containing protein [Dimargaris cristalligena]
MADTKAEAYHTEDQSSTDPRVKKGNIFKRAFYHHWRDQPYQRTEAQIDRERFLIGNIPFNRWILFPVAVLIQFCCGSLYAWSIYNKPIDKAISGNENANDAPITFYLAVGLLGFSAAAMGPVLERRGPRFGCLIGSCCFFIGHLLSALAVHTKQMWLLYIGYGIIGGYGLGFCYISPVSALQKWFPDHRGMAAGFAVCGFGAGSIAFAQIPVPLIKSLGVPKTFIIMGCIYFCIMMPCGWLLRVPPPNYTINGMDAYRERVSTTEVDVENGEVEKVDEAYVPAPTRKQPNIKMTLVESLLDRDFRLLYLVFVGNSVFGLVVISRLSTMIVDIFGKSTTTASAIVSANGGFNLAGRLLFSIISDKVGRKTCLVFTLTVQCIVIGVVTLILEEGSYGAFIAMMWIISSCYGAGFGIIPAFLTDMYGPKNIGACHGIILTAWSIAGVAGGLAFTGIFNNLISGGRSTKDYNVYVINFWWILAITILGWCFSIFVRTTLRDRLLPPVEGQIFRIRIFGQLIRLVKDDRLRLQFVKKVQEDAEWDRFVDEINSAEERQSLTDNSNRDRSNSL